MVIILLIDHDCSLMNIICAQLVHDADHPLISCGCTKTESIEFSYRSNVDLVGS